MRRLSSDELGLWHRAMRDVAPLPGRTRPAPHREHDRRQLVGAPEKVVEAPAIPRRAKLSRPSVPRSETQQPGHFTGIDRASAERLKRGRYPIDGRLDLHGMTQAEAHRALSGFVAMSRLAGRRCVLVITGHGRVSGGVLKAVVPRWLAEPELRRHLIAITPAQQRDGGAGALYVLLRRLPH